MISPVYNEGPATYTHQRRDFTCDGAHQTEEHIVGYMGKEGVLTNWQGEPIGRYTIESAWPTPAYHLSRKMYQLWVKANGRTYTGRSAGEGMLFRGKRIAAEKRR